MTTTSHLALADAQQRRRDCTLHDPSVDLVGASRPSAVRALLIRSVTMTALELERRLRTRRRKASTQARSPRSLALPRQRRVSRAVHEAQAADAGLQRTLLRFP